MGNWYDHVVDILRNNGVNVTVPTKGGQSPTTTFNEWRKLYTKGIAPELIQKQREHASMVRRAAVDKFIPASLRKHLDMDYNSVPHILPYAPNGEPTKLDPVTLYAHTRLWPQPNDIKLERAPNGRMMNSSAFPALGKDPAVIKLGDAPVSKNDRASILRAYLNMSDADVKSLPPDLHTAVNSFVAAQSAALAPWQPYRNSIYAMIHEGLHLPNIVYNAGRVPAKLRTEIKATEGTQLPPDGVRRLIPYLPGWRRKAHGPYVKPPVDGVDYFSNLYLSPRRQYFTTGVPGSKYKDPSGEAGTGTAQLVANEMAASGDYPRSYSHLLAMAKQRGALTVDADGQLHVDYSKFFSAAPDMFNPLDSGMVDFIEAENLYRRAERDYGNSLPGLYINNHTDIPQIKHVVYGSGPVATKIMNQMARDSARKYRANMDQLIGGAYL